MTRSVLQGQCSHWDIEYADINEMRSNSMYCKVCGVRGSRDDLEKRVLDMRKDDILFNLIQQGYNVAQFIGIDSVDIYNPRHVYINGLDSHKQYTLKELIVELINRSKSKYVNIRSYQVNNMKGNRFVYKKGIDDIDEIMYIIQENAQNGLESIVNENIDISDGGVSGVLLSNIVEFSPNDTPRCVEKEGVCSLDREIGLEMLEKVYGFSLKKLKKISPTQRVEFSIHPQRQGIKQEHVIFWEMEDVGWVQTTSQLNIPNNFSRYIGDKVFGLLLADCMDIPVPKSTVINRSVAPFNFGKDTGCNEVWIRTAPSKKLGGYYDTFFGWVDPFELINSNENRIDSCEDDCNIPSLISQKSVLATYSGAGMFDSESLDLVIEGVAGYGDEFMIDGKKESLPNNIFKLVCDQSMDIFNTFDIACNIGDVSFEWVLDENNELWIVQFNKLNHKSTNNIIVPAECENIEYIDFDTTTNDIDSLRGIIKHIQSQSAKGGVRVLGNIGVTSHIGDILRASSIPSFVEKGV